MADGTLKVGTITNSAGSGNITIGSGVTLLSNVPAFQAHLSSDQSITDNTFTKVEFDTEAYDTDNCYDNSTNYRFTPNKAGKYYVYSSIRGDAQADSNLQYHTVQIYKNGSAVGKQIQNFQANYPRVMSQPITYVVDMNGSTDYLEIYYLFNDTSGNPIINGDASPAETFFGAYRIGA
jgi:hypothetical protein